MNLKELKEKKISDLIVLADTLKIEGGSSMRKQDLIFALLQAELEKNGQIYGEGVLEILPDGKMAGISNRNLIEAPQKQNMLELRSNGIDIDSDSVSVIRLPKKV